MNHRYRRLGSLFLVVISLLGVYQIVFAGCCASASLAGSTVNAVKSNITLNPLTWRAQIESISGTSGEGPTLDELGWTWWHAYEKCNSLDIDLTILPAVSVFNKAYQSRVYDQMFNSCSGTKQTGNKGNHVFKKNGTTVNLAPHYVRAFP